MGGVGLESKAVVKGLKLLYKISKDENEKRRTKYMNGELFIAFNSKGNLRVIRVCMSSGKNVRIKCSSSGWGKICYSGKWTAPLLPPGWCMGNPEAHKTAPKPDGWEDRQDECFFYNQKTKEATFDKPQMPDESRAKVLRKIDNYFFFDDEHQELVDHFLKQDRRRLAHAGDTPRTRLLLERR